MILLRNCLAIQGLDAGFDILIEGNRISRIGRGLKVPVSASGEVEIIDCSNSVVVPGFVNTHHHFYQTLTRNLPAVQNAKLFTWLRHLYEIWKNIDPDAIYWSTVLATAELLKTGCTCTTDHHYLYPNGFSDDIMGLQFAGAGKTGIRFAPTRGSMSLSKKDGGLPPDTVVQDEETILADSERVISRYHDPAPLSMRRVSLAPCSPFSVTPDLMKRTAELARKHGVRLHTHLAETADEDSFCMKKFGKRPLALMEECGFIGPDVSYAHGIFFTDDELKLLAETRTGICHCPSSNMRLGSGIARIREMVALNIPVSIAVDGSASNDSSDYLGEMRQALLLQRVRYGSDALTASDVYHIASEGGASILGFEKIGKIAEGWGADIAVFDTRRIEYVGSGTDPVASLLFCGTGHQTAYTIVNGKIVVREGRLTGIDEDEIIKKGSACARRLTG